MTNAEVLALVIGDELMKDDALSSALVVVGHDKLAEARERVRVGELACVVAVFADDTGQPTGTFTGYRNDTPRTMRDALADALDRAVRASGYAASPPLEVVG